VPRGLLYAAVVSPTAALAVQRLSWELSPERGTAAALPAVALAGLLVPGWAPSTWLLPAFGFAAVVLALSTWMSPLRATIGVSLAWLFVVWMLMLRAGSPDTVLEARSQAIYVGLAIVSIIVFVVRGRHLRELRPRRNWS